MTTRTIHGVEWRVISPSLMHYDHPDGRVSLGFNCRGWVIGVNGNWGSAEWPTRDEAAQVVADTLAMQSRGLA